MLTVLAYSGRLPIDHMRWRAGVKAEQEDPAMTMYFPVEVLS